MIEIDFLTSACACAADFVRSKRKLPLFLCFLMCFRCFKASKQRSQQLPSKALLQRRVPISCILPLSALSLCAPADFVEATSAPASHHFDTVAQFLQLWIMSAALSIGRSGLQLAGSYGRTDALALFLNGLYALNARINECTRPSAAVSVCVYMHVCTAIYLHVICGVWRLALAWSEKSVGSHVYLGQVGYRRCGMLLFSVAALWIRCLQHRHLIYKVLLFRLPPTYWKASRALVCTYKHVYNVPHVACHNQWLTVGALMSDEWRKIKAAVGYCSCYLRQGRVATCVCMHMGWCKALNKRTIT